jgi:ABC-2 type transport system ATP-binding protein
METLAVEAKDLLKRYNAGARALRSAFYIRTYFQILRGAVKEWVTALDGISLEIKKGEVFGLLGPNGAGKTTFIKILSTLVLPDSGKALVCGIDVVKKPRRVLQHLQTVLSEGFGFERRLTARQNLMFYATLYGIPRDEAEGKIKDLLEFTGLSTKADVMFQKYSTGLSRRLLLCRALLRNSSVLLFDEPTTSLDPVAAIDFRQLLKERLAHRDGRTVIVATHNMWEAQQICDRVALINHGKIVAVESPDKMRRSISDKMHISLVIAGAGLDNNGFDDFLAGLTKVEGVIDISTRTDFSPEEIVVNVESYRDADFTEIFSLIPQHKLRIRSIEATEPSLEEAFVRLVDDR